LFEALDPLKYTYAGEVELVGAPYQEEQVDDTGQTRKVWMFPVELKGGGTIPTLTDEQARAIEESHARVARRLSMEKLQARAKRAKKQPSVRIAQASAYVRDAAVAEYARRLANGLCDLCEKPAPFFGISGKRLISNIITLPGLPKVARTRSPIRSRYAQIVTARCTF
jgi:5-methylcytosine-specific restriction enzyme A